MSQTQTDALDFIKESFPDRYLLRKSEVCKLIRVSAATLDRMVKDGNITATKERGKVFFTRDEIARYLAR